MKESEVLERINSYKNWYHKIEIMPGIITPGINESKIVLERLKIPEDCSGLRVLDLGTRDGFFAFEFEKRGAEVIAMDYMPAEKTGFHIAAELLNSRVTFIHENVYNISPDKYGYFDIVLFLGLLYHLRDPLYVIDKIRAVCKDILYLETFVIDNRFLLPDGSMTSLDSISKLLRDIPIMQFYPGDSLNKGITNYWGPNLKCVELMLEEANFSILEKNLYNDRAIVKCKVDNNKRKEFFMNIARGLVE